MLSFPLSFPLQIQPSSKHLPKTELAINPVSHIDDRCFDLPIGFHWVIAFRKVAIIEADLAHAM
jgi:hypothetical protein